jgi:hypothetical protein
MYSSSSEVVVSLSVVSCPMAVADEAEVLVEGLKEQPGISTCFTFDLDKFFCIFRTP